MTEPPGVIPKKDYFRVKNDWWDALVKTHMPGNVRQCLDYIIRMTYGWQRKEAQIPIMDFVDATGLKKSHISRSLAALKEAKVIIVTKNGNNMDKRMLTYSFNKYYEQWRPIVTNYGNKKQVTGNGNNKLPETVTNLTKNGNYLDVTPINRNNILKNSLKNTIAKNGLDKKSKAVLKYLNRKKGSKYRDYSFITPRLKEGATVKDCIQVINNKLADEYFQKNPRFLNPETLFRKSHWDKYLNDTPHPLHGKVSKTTQKNIETLKSWGNKNEK